LTLLSVVLTGLALHTFVRYRDTQEARNAGAAMLAQVLATQFGADVPRSREELQRACDRLIEHPAVLAVRVWDQSGAPAGGAEVLDGLLAQLGGAQPPGGPDVSVEPAALSPGFGAENAVGYRVEADLGMHLRAERPARMAMLLALSSSFQDSAMGRVWIFCVVMTAVGGLAFVFGSRHLRRRVVHPIMRLVEVAASAGGRDGPASRAAREDELGAVARSLSELREDLGTWRSRAEVIERRMDSQIAAETQRVRGDLRRVQRDAWRDPLTGVNNRRMLEEKFAEIFAAQRHAKEDLAVIMFDLDDFKVTNDTLGHLAGDRILAFMGELLRQCSRADDIAVRYGGDEFVLILPGTSARKALIVAEQIIALFAQRARMLVSTPRPPTVSVGIASLWNNRPAHHAELLELADRALYKAKWGGKAIAHVHNDLEQLPCY
jgi:diguanylate cyclase (GGDEF)-like protein